MTDGNDKSAEAQKRNPAASNDVLFGWLVGRAAADLGLAQALAANEAQRAEQFKRLEESLLAQVRDLPSYANPDSAQTNIQFDELKTQIQKVAERMGGFESVVQQLTHAPDLANAQVSSLESRWDQRQSSLEAQQAQTNQLTGEILERVHDIERRVISLPQADHRAETDVATLKQELLAIKVRLEQAEASHKEIHDKTTHEIAGVQEAAASFVRTEVADLKNQITQLLDRQTANDKSVQIIDALRQQIENLHSELSQSTERNNEAIADMAELRVHGLNLAQQLESLGTKVTSTAIHFETERRRLDQEVVKQISVNTGQLGDEMRQALQEIDELKTNRKAINEGVDSLAARMRYIERTTEELAERIGGELDAARKILNERENRYSAIEAQLKNLQETVVRALQQLDRNLAQFQERLDGGESHDQEFREHLEQTTRRIAEIESMVHHARSSMINDCAQSEQQRSEFAAELSALRAQLRDSQRWEADIRVLEDRLNARVNGLEHQLAEKIPSPDLRYAEVRELKTQLETFSEKLAAIEVHSQSQQPLLSRGRDLKPVNLDSVQKIGLPDERAKLAISRTQDGQQEHQLVPHKADQPTAKGLVKAEDPLQSLQARMSADIERARAELREKSGRWKLRH